jgi:hypothetical protein
VLHVDEMRTLLRPLVGLAGRLRRH